MSRITIKSCCLKRFPLILKNYNLNFSSQVDPSNLKAIAMAHQKYDTSTKNTNSPIVIMHGLFGSKTNWKSICNALTKTKLNRDVISVDARDHGESPRSTEFSYYHLVADINKFFNDMNINKACLIGHSMGGRAMMLFALSYPQKAEKLIVVDISPFDRSRSIGGMKFYFDALKSIKLPAGIQISEARKFADNQLARAVDDRDVRQFLLTNLMKKEDGNFGWKVNLEVVSANFEKNIVRFPIHLKKIYDKPTLFIGGKHSDYISQSDEKPIKNIFPAAEFTYLDCGHWVHAEKPEEFIKLTTNFFKSE